ncbi:hypothetical protein GCM10010401_13080 [Rarobacter faecitabidus]|uniref:Uncharacterized protein n=1 Tax=Rarobacter faecitabidus TaxID=13243 RepID=A0A542ZE78_RARFA|nr:hypothetical protein [Rarobacter faecitabidus]TQL58643.1 hypothetical protein FB461_2061 [Rarobacter faecitabidus]
MTVLPWAIPAVIAAVIITAVVVVVVQARNGNLAKALIGAAAPLTTDAQGQSIPPWIAGVTGVPGNQRQARDITALEQRSYRGHDVACMRLRVIDRRSSSDTYRRSYVTIVMLRLRGSWPQLSISPEGAIASMFKNVGTHEHVIGWPPFDNTYIVKSSDPGFAQAMFAPAYAPRYLHEDLRGFAWTIDRFSLSTLRYANISATEVDALTDKLIAVAENIPPDVKRFHEAQSEETRPLGGYPPGWNADSA